MDQQPTVPAYLNFFYFIPKMTAHEKMTLKIILTEADIRKVILNMRPVTVE